MTKTVSLCLAWLARLAVLGLFATSVHAQGRPDPKELIAAQQAALAPLRIFDGVWRGPFTIWLPRGQELQNTQIERVGGLLSDSIKLIEGRGWAADGTLSFNAFGVISYSPFEKKFSFHSYAQGFSGDFPLEVRPDGFTWTAPAGPGATIRYTATVKEGAWIEVGDLLVEGRPPQRTFEMALKRVADTDWPAAGAVPQR